MEITNYAIIIWITAILIVSLDAVIIIGSKNLSSRVFVFFSFMTAIWVASQGFLISNNITELSDFILRIQYILGIVISVGFYNFSTIYPYDTKPTKKSIIISFCVVMVFVYLYIFTDVLISGVHQITSNGRWAWEFGSLHLLFDFSFYILWIISLMRLYKTYKQSSSDLKLNLKNMFFALFLGIIPPTITNVFLPSLGEFHFNWLGPITSSIWIFILAYSIIKYRQMSVKTIVTEVLAIGMTSIFFINIFINISSSIWLRVIIFIILITLASYLIRSSFHESRQKALLRELNDTLEQKVNEKTAEVKKSLELEKKARRELEKLNETKDQFIVVTQHHLRSSITSISSEIKSVFSRIGINAEPEIKKSFERINTSTVRLTRVVDDFLNISKLKAGSKIINTSSGSMKPLLEDILQELSIDINNLNLSISYEYGTNKWPNIMVDQNKIKEALLIIIENAVKYNIVDGTVSIKTKTEYDTFEIIVENTGVGITHDEKNKLFSKLFYRGERAKTNNPFGMGMGLSIARAIVQAHHGEITLTSGGENKGAKVVMSLPFDFIKRINSEIELSLI